MNLILARATIEALIFSSSQPVAAGEIAEIIGISIHTTEQLIKELEDEYRSSHHGLQLIKAANGYQICTIPVCAPYLEKLKKVPRTGVLSPATLETLAIIAYKQPITKAEIESLRGVKADSSIHTLLEKDLIEEAGRKDTVGRPILYRTTRHFLLHFGLNSLNELPHYEDWPDQLNFAAARELKENGKDEEHAQPVEGEHEEGVSA
ncbi:MAG: SMC-Scp complex subunit ScpB [Bacillota bacterium]